MAEYTAASLSAAHVQAAVNLADTGDTVILPSGSASWADAAPNINVTKAITIRGAGQGVTNIELNLSATWAHSGFYINPLSSGTFEMSDITFTGTTAYPAAIYVDDVRRIRIHHITFNDLAGYCLSVRERTYGLVDHCIWTGSFNTGIVMNAITLENKWYQATPIATATGVLYIEDNDFSAGYFSDGYVDAYQGVCYVYRHNVSAGNDTTINEMGCHGCDSVENRRSARWFEIYSNTFNHTGSGGYPSRRAICYRGGSGVVYSNTFSSVWNTPLELCANRACYLYSWAGLIAYGNNLDNVDGGTDAEGWPGRDQIGRGIDSLNWSTFPTGTRSLQASEPLYQWSNVQGGSPITAGINDSYGDCKRQQYMIVEGRDYYDNEQMPGYSALAYPHPLQGVTPNINFHSSMRLRF
jgi:hypothetical protein